MMSHVLHNLRLLLYDLLVNVNSSNLKALLYKQVTFHLFSSNDYPVSNAAFGSFCGEPFVIQGKKPFQLFTLSQSSTLNSC